MPRNKTVAVRLDEPEISALRKLPGSTDGERIRTLLHAQAMGSQFVDSVASAVASALSKKLDQNHTETTALIKAVGPILQQMDLRILTAIGGLRK